MLALDSRTWHDLRHAYGPAGGIPDVLRALAEFRIDDELHNDLWSSLCHQTTIYTASYAAVPHLVALGRGAPDRVDWSTLRLAVHIERSRAFWACGSGGDDLPTPLAPAYHDAVAALPDVAASAYRRQGAPFDVVGAEVVAIAGGDGALADAIDEFAWAPFHDQFDAWLAGEPAAAVHELPAPFADVRETVARYADDLGAHRLAAAARALDPSRIERLEHLIYKMD